MSYTMCSRITFPATEHRDEMKLHFVTSVTVKSSWKMLTSTAEIVMPRMVQAFGKRSLFDRFRPGDPVTVELGYNAGYVKEFEGYILNVGQGVPVTVTCEDEMYMLKRKAVSYSKRSVTLARLLADVPVTAHWLAGLGVGGLCLNCPECHFPNCGFGKGLA